jgi:hypothetical protein
MDQLFIQCKFFLLLFIVTEIILSYITYKAYVFFSAMMDFLLSSGQETILPENAFLVCSKVSLPFAFMIAWWAIFDHKILFVATAIFVLYHFVEMEIDILESKYRYRNERILI